jgi:hypothetical protein
MHKHGSVQHHSRHYSNAAIPLMVRWFAAVSMAKLADRWLAVMMQYRDFVKELLA